MVVVDTHVYPLAADLAKYPLAPVGAQAEWSKGVHLTPDDIFELMTNAGVDRGHLVQALTVHGYDNSYCADVCALYPDKFVGICGLNAWAPEGADTLSYWVEKRGLRGVRIYALNDDGKANLNIDDPATFPVWERASQLGAPVEIGLVGDLGMVARVLEKFPDVRVLFHHMGLATRQISLEEGPPYGGAKGLFELAKFPNLYLQATNRLLREAGKGKSTPAAFFKVLCGVFGAERLVWGSTYPGADGSYGQAVADLRSALEEVAPSEKDAILGRTASFLYRYDA